MPVLGKSRDLFTYVAVYPAPILIRVPIFSLLKLK